VPNDKGTSEKEPENDEGPSKPFSIIMQDQNRDHKEILKNLNILIVDDILEVRKIFIEIFRELGVEGHIDTAGNGLEAWKMMQINNYDVVISDILMPVMTGLELRKLIRSTPKFARLPFLIVSGEVSEDKVDCLIESDRDSYLLKPFSVAVLEKRILQLLE
jgi:two-component system chemotaxis response regulator CheY